MTRGKITIYQPEEIVGVRAAAQASAMVLKRLCDAVTPGMTTADVDHLAASKVMIHFDDALIPQPGTDSSVADNNGHI